MNPKDPPISAPPDLGLQVPKPGFHVGPMDLNSGPHVLWANTLLTEPAPQFP